MFPERKPVPAAMKALGTALVAQVSNVALLASGAPCFRWQQELSAALVRVTFLTWVLAVTDSVVTCTGGCSMSALPRHRVNPLGPPDTFVNLMSVDHILGPKVNGWAIGTVTRTDNPASFVPFRTAIVTVTDVPRTVDKLGTMA
ncbi:hypothetical protein NUW58_g10924 [Xylaria curta]|uniref:Uncharacterized protein n=1 Tax=Xylaria curta TaxID=42375 RepID=A0ACC1MEU9_9PEZI|nr:hypothetical protein NUW58_g10924 [Xylaria curta]